MNSREYIESGVLDLYVSGLLSIEEMRDVELKACQYPDVKGELESLQNAMERFAFKHAIAPRAELKAKIMRAVQQHEGSRTIAFNVKDEEKSASSRNADTRAMPVSGTNYSRMLAAAAVILLAIMSGVALYLNNEYQKSQSQVAQLEEQQSGILKQIDNIQLALKNNAEKLQLVTDANTLRVTMKGTDKSPASMALIYWNKETQAVYLDVKALPPAATDKQYQLWFIDPKVGPVSAGVFDVKTGEMIRMQNASNAAAFAVTLEPRGGSVNPSMEQMYVIGNTNS